MCVANGMHLVASSTVIVAVSGAALPSALALYWTVSNVVSYGQDIYVKNKLAHLKPEHH
jgi:membrane protein insertase Oxa1/YidC/SpoIIIJ